MKKTLIIIFSILTGMAIMYFYIEVKNNCFIQNNAKKNLNKIIKILVRQAARWSTAALQDKSDLIAVLHANYGAGYLWALKDIASKSDIEQAANINFNRFESDIVNTMDIVTKNLIKTCPDFAPPKSYLTQISGEGL